MPEPIYAIQSANRWHIAKLRLYTEFQPKLGHTDKPPVWVDAETTALICDWHEPEQIVRLPTGDE